MNSKLSRLLTVTAALSLLPAIACAGGDASVDEATPARTERVGQASPTSTREPTPEPTPAPAAGWTRYATDEFEIDLPDTWETWDPSAETLATLLHRVGEANPELAGMAEEVFASQSEPLALMAFDTESPSRSLRTINILRQDLAGPTTIPAFISESEKTLAGLGLTVLSTDTDLSLGGAKSGSIASETDLGTSKVRQVQYVVLPEPTLLFVLSLGTTADDYPALRATFESIAKSFNIR